MDLANFVLTFGPAGLVVYSLGKRLIMAGRAQRPAVAREESEQRPRPPLPSDQWYRVGRAAPRVMSRAAGGVAIGSARGAVAATMHGAGQRMAMPTTPINEALSGNAVAAPLPAEVRDIIRDQARAESVVALLTTKTMTNKALAIELIFACKRSGRAGSPYQQALALVESHISRYPNRTEAQELNRQELELSQSA